jgi:hypothetical protein
VYRALRRDPDERYQSMDDLRYDLEHLDEVAIPEYQVTADEPSVASDLPSPKAMVGIVVGVFAGLILIGLLAEVVHRGMLAR